MKTNKLKLFFLGPPQIELDNQPIEIHLHKALALMAFLAIKGQNHRRDTLAMVFWPDCNQVQARSYLRNALWVLKESLGECWFTVYREEVSLQLGDSIWVDVNTFQQHLKAVELHHIMHPSNDLCPVCIDHLTNAVDLYRDDFLSGFTLRDSPAFDEWQDFQCESLRQELGNVLERLALWHTRQGNSAASIAFVRRLVFLDPYHEKARQLLMEAYYKTGRRADALQQYQDYAKTLKQELNLLPSAEITELYKSMKADSIELIDGDHLEALERSASSQPLQTDIFSAAYHDVSLGEPLAFIPPIPFPKRSPFVKRESALEKLTNLLRESVSGHGKSIFISGGPGSGKTTLALEFIHQAQKEYLDLIVSGGNCLPPTGLGNPYAVFQDVLNLLAGEVEERWAEGILTAENLNRLFTFLPRVLQTLVDSSPDLITTFLPTLNLSSKGWTYENQSLNASSLMVKWFLQDFHTQKTKTLNQNLIFQQYLKTIQVLSAQQPIMLILDDLHWADPYSIRLLSHLCKNIDHSRTLIIGTYCPQELTNGWHVSKHDFPELINAFRQLDSDPVIDLDQTIKFEGQEFTNAYLDLEPNHLSVQFKKEMYRITGGQPLFLTEYLQEMKDKGELHRDEEKCWADPESFYDQETLPDSVEAVIEARINRLPEEFRNVMEAASVEGIEFTIETVASALMMDRLELTHLLIQESSHHPLVVPLSLYKSGPRRLSWFRFRHSLFQKCLYNQLDPYKRAHFHEKIGISMEQIYGEQVEEISNQLARHFQEAGNTDKANYYLQMANRRAIRLGANQIPSQIL